MRTLKSIATLLLLALVIPGRAAEEPCRTDINPALLYYQALLLDPDFTQTDRDYLFDRQWRGTKLPDRVGELVGNLVQFKLVRQAARSTVPCDWGIDLSQGPNALLPHLARLKRLAQTAELRISWFVQNGRQADARDDILATLALARNASRDGTLIAALVQIAIENIVCNTIAENFYRFTPETLEQLEAGFATAPARGMMAACIPTEKAGFHDWLVGRVQALRILHPGDDKAVLAGTRKLMESLLGPNEKANEFHQPEWDLILAKAGGTSEGLLNMLQGELPLYQHLEDIMKLPCNEFGPAATKFRAELDKIADPIVALSLPAFEKARNKEFTIAEQLSMLQAAIELKLRGTAGFDSVSDPCGNGSFKLERIYYESLDRGFRLTSSYTGNGYPEALVFIQKEGPPLFVTGPDAGKPIKP